jgi:hypothetical protein
MPKVTISKETAARLTAFHRLGELLGEGELPPDELAEALIVFGMRTLMERLFHPLSL